MSYAATDGTSDRTDWWLCSQRMPAEGEPVRTKVDDESGLREIGILKRKGDVWFHMQGGTKTCWTPTHWHALSDSERKEVEQDALDRAIAKAAPELLATCEDVLDDLMTISKRMAAYPVMRDTGMLIQLGATQDKLLAAISKVTGEAVPDGS